MLDSMLMTAAMQHAVGRATHDELRAELTRRIAVGDVIAEDPLYRPADDREGSPGKTRAVLEDEMQRDRRVPIDAAVRAIDEAIRERQPGTDRGPLHDRCGLAHRAIHLADGTRRPSPPEADDECPSCRSGDLADRPQSRTTRSGVA